MLLWTGAILCFLAYGIQAAMEDEPANDNVRSLWNGKLDGYTSSLYLELSPFSLLTVVPGRCALRRRHHHRLLLLLSRGQELQDHGLLQEPGPSGAPCRFSV